MNQFRAQLAIFFAVFLLTAPLASAQISQTPQAAPAAQTSVSAGIYGADTLAVRKARVEAGLRDLLTRFGTAYSRTQFAIGRVANTNLAAANAELAKAGAALQEAKADIDAFAAIAVVEGDAAVTLALRTKALASEESLRDARASLLASIAAVRVSLPPTSAQ